MKNKKIIITLFVIVALVQLYVPAKMIFDSENVLKKGVAYKFEAAPVDPNDPFRGKFINLRFKENSIQVADQSEWKDNEQVYVILGKNNEGYAKIAYITKEIPKNTSDYVKASIDIVSGDKSNLVYVEYPFDRYYMEETKAYEAELTYNEAIRDTAIHDTYALVYVKNGEAVLQDVLIDDISIKEIVENRNNH